ncbi:signal peptidase I [Acidobacteriota bacterium]
MTESERTLSPTEHERQNDTGSRCAPPPKSLLRDYAETIIVAVLLVLIIKTFVFQQFKIPTESMQDTLLIGDHLMVNKFIYGVPTHTALDHLLPTREVRRQDVIVFRSPKRPSVDYIKRAMGLPGERVAIKKKVLFVNGEPLAEGYIRHTRPGTRGLGDEIGPRDIDFGYYFVLGDNRDESNDSRFWGEVPEDLIRGRAFLIWWSFAERPGDWKKRDLKSRSRQIYEKLRFFFTKTRWDRMFSIVR